MKVASESPHAIGKQYVDGCSYHRRRCPLSLDRLQNPHPHGGAAELPLVDFSAPF